MLYCGLARRSCQEHLIYGLQASALAPTLLLCSLRLWRVTAPCPLPFPLSCQTPSIHQKLLCYLFTLLLTRHIISSDFSAGSGSNHVTVICMPMHKLISDQVRSPAQLPEAIKYTFKEAPRCWYLTVLINRTCQYIMSYNTNV